jgi:hypothetical protein
VAGTHECTTSLIHRVLTRDEVLPVSWVLATTHGLGNSAGRCRDRSAIGACVERGRDTLRGHTQTRRHRDGEIASVATTKAVAIVSVAISAQMPRIVSVGRVLNPPAARPGLATVPQMPSGSSTEDDGLMESIYHVQDSLIDSFHHD